MKIKFVSLFMIAGILFSLAAAVLTTGTAHAFNGNNLIDDVIFNNYNSMSATEIDNWINANFPNSCISTNTGFSAPDPTGYTPSGGYTYGGNVSAGRVIAHAAQAYGINPQVLLVTLQKEQSLVSGGAGCSTRAYTGAMGYGCPDGGTTHSYSGVNLYTLRGTTYTSISGTCVNTAAKAGFSQQVIHGAWLLKFGQQRSKGNIGWNVQRTNSPQAGDVWDNSDDPQTCYSGPMTQGSFKTCPGDASPTYYDGWTTIDGQATHMDTGATAALYWYTPHFSGNQHFDSIFISWFGNIYGSVAQFAGQSPYPTLHAGQATTAYVMYQNNGNTNWYDDTVAAANGQKPVHLAVTNPINSRSPFSWGWPDGARPVVVFDTVYNSDGTTLANPQHVVQPGQIVKMSFNITVPYGFTPGKYTLYVQPVLDGASAWDMGGLAWWDVNVVPDIYSASYSGQSPYPSLHDNQSISSYIQYKNTGNMAWYDDATAASSGQKPVHLAATNPINRQSRFSNGWGDAARPAKTFGAVYEANGTTLAANQHVVQPGQIARFNFNLTVPKTLGAGSYTEYMQPVHEGASNWDMGGLAWTVVTVPSIANTAQYRGQSGYPTLSPGQAAASFLQYKNTGSTIWYDDTTAAANNAIPLHLAVTNPINSVSAFSWGWPSMSRAAVTFGAVYEADGTTPAANQHAVQPGQIVRFNFNLTVPYGYAKGKYSVYLQPVIDGAGNWNPGGTAWFDINVN